MQNIIELKSISELLQYFTGEITTTTATKKYACTGIGTGLAAGDVVLFAGFDQSGSNGEKTLVTVAANEITVSETIGTGETKAGCTLKQALYTAWEDASFYTHITGTGYVVGGDCTVTQQFRYSSAGNIFSATAQTLTAGTAAAITAIAVPSLQWRCKFALTGTADLTVAEVRLFGVTP